MQEQIHTDIEATSTGFMKTLALFTDGQINKIPFEKSWTPGQVVNHIYKSLTGVLHVVREKSVPIQRDYREKDEPIKKLFLDFNVQFTSPHEILPTELPLDKNKLIIDMEILWQEFHHVVKQYNLTDTCVTSELPVFGELSRYEWIYFALYHTQRHHHQLEKIYAKMNQHK